ncbi:MAG: Flp pilus assembly complex ATPase component TadA [Oscillospiraceae bacterium]|nr:Flp pilus assembly complex ATPase component TadA [Oscillospiraceae bacterium]
MGRGEWDINEFIYGLSGSFADAGPGGAGTAEGLAYGDALEKVKGLISANHATELAGTVEDEGARDRVKGLITRYVESERMRVRGHESLATLVDAMYEDMAGFSFLSKYIYDDAVEEINANAWDDIEVVTGSGWRRLDERFQSPEQCVDMVCKLMRLGGVVIDASKPAQDSYITKGVRVSAIIPPCVDDDVGAVFSIRKQKGTFFTKERMVGLGTATEETLDFLIMCVNHGIRVGIAGATGSGKTTDIAFLLSCVGKDKRIFSIEDSRELSLTGGDGPGGRGRVIHARTREGKDGKNEVSANFLLKKALRFHPDIIVPAEMRGEEAMTAQEAGRTGHTILTSLHASTALAAYTRILTMCMLTGVRLSEELMLKLIVEAFPIMVFKKQLPDLSRKYMRVIEAEDYVGGRLIYRTLFRFVVTGKEMAPDGGGIARITGYHKRVGRISDRLAGELLENGCDIGAIRAYAGEGWDPAGGDGE